MRLRSITVTYSKDDAGVTKPLRVAHAKMLRDASDPAEILFGAGGAQQPRSHMVSFDLDNPLPENDPNANITDADVQTIKTIAATHASGGVIVPVVDN